MWDIISNLRNAVCIRKNTTLFFVDENSYDMNPLLKYFIYSIAVEASCQSIEINILGLRLFTITQETDFYSFFLRYIFVILCHINHKIYKFLRILIKY